MALEWKRQEGEGEMGKRDQMYGDRWKLNFLVVSILQVIHKSKYIIAHMKYKML